MVSTKSAEFPFRRARIWRLATESRDSFFAALLSVKVERLAKRNFWRENQELWPTSRSSLWSFLVPATSRNSTSYDRRNRSCPTLSLGWRSLLLPKQSWDIWSKTPELLKVWTERRSIQASVLQMGRCCYSMDRWTRDQYHKTFGHDRLLLFNIMLRVCNSI